MGWNVHDEDVTDSPRRAQPHRRGGHRTHEFISMQAAFHQKLALGLVDQRDGLCSGGFAVRSVHQLIASDIDPMLLGDGTDPGGGPDQNGHDDT
jgi:hypothetical protein